MEDPSDEPRIRAAELGDAAAIDALILDLDAFHAKALPEQFRVPTGSPRGDDFVKTVLSDPEQGILVAERRGKVIGYVHFVAKTTTPSSHRAERRYLEIDTISVRADEQGRGIGRSLIQAAAQWASAKGIRDHQIAVHEFNRSARRLYEKLGFQPSVTLLRRKGE